MELVCCVVPDSWTIFWNRQTLLEFDICPNTWCSLPLVPRPWEVGISFVGIVIEMCSHEASIVTHGIAQAVKRLNAWAPLLWKMLAALNSSACLSLSWLSCMWKFAQQQVQKLRSWAAKLLFPDEVVFVGKSDEDGSCFLETTTQDGWPFVEAI